MKYTFLTREFYDVYKNCKEIENKLLRPYIQVCIKIDNIMFAIPLRSNIKHEHVFWTDKANRCGLDFSKSVVIVDIKYLNTTQKPHIRENEFNVLQGQEYQVKQKLITYIKKYKKARENIDKQHNKLLCQYSTLQYFHKELGI